MTIKGDGRGASHGGDGRRRSGYEIDDFVHTGTETQVPGLDDPAKWPALALAFSLWLLLSDAAKHIQARTVSLLLSSKIFEIADGEGSNPPRH
jgi:hypothetical protein